MREERNEAEGEGALPAEDASGGGDTDTAAKPRRRRSRGRGGRARRTRTPTDQREQTLTVAEAAEQEGERAAEVGEAPRNGEPQAGDAAAEDEGAPTRRTTTRRRSRGGRGRGRSSAPAAVAESAEPQPEEAPKARPRASTKAKAAEAAREPRAAGEPEGEEAPAAEGTTAQRTRRRRRRGGRGRSRTRAAEEGGAPKSPTLAAERAEAAKKARGLVPIEVEPAPEPLDLEEPAPEEEAGRPTRVRRPRPTRRRREPVAVTRVGDKVMLITEIGDRDQIAVLEGRTLVEHYITRAGARSMVGNVYLGKVQNVLPGMEAAFVDLGRGRNAVLYAGEVSYDEEVEGDTRRIEQVLKAGQNVMVQVTKDPMGGKGARLTQEISLPGRYLVLVPNSMVFGISRRLPDRERERLRDILKKLRPTAHGVIARTAAEDATAEDLAADLERLQAEWETLQKSAKRGRAPRLLYEEPELTVRVVRDLFTGGEFKEMVTDSPEVYRKVVEYLQTVAPDLVSRVRMHEGPLPLFEAFHVEEQIHKALDRKVWLPSGGYVVIDRTEAMTIIDVNTGKHVGKANLEETVTKTNLEAAEEIARQLRLRDIGGIIIIDFIDMLFERNRQKVIQTLRNALARDKTRSQVFDISALGLLEVTRKRVSAGLVESFSETCPTCEGRGIVLTHKL